MIFASFIGCITMWKWALPLFIFSTYLFLTNYIWEISQFRQLLPEDESVAQVCSMMLKLFKYRFKKCRISSVDALENDASVLVNGHYDGPIGSPGAADCGSCVGRSFYSNYVHLNNLQLLRVQKVTNTAFNVILQHQWWKLQDSLLILVMCPLDQSSSYLMVQKSSFFW